MIVFRPFDLFFSPDLHARRLRERRCKNLPSTLLDNDANTFLAWMQREREREKRKKFRLVTREGGNMSMHIASSGKIIIKIKEPDENTILYTRGEKTVL
jgi:DNA-binding IclR family transcriptional regulator